DPRPYKRMTKSPWRPKQTHVRRTGSLLVRLQDKHAALARLWQMELNYFIAISIHRLDTEDTSSWRKRVYYRPITSYQRLLVAGALSTSQQDKFEIVYRSINPFQLILQTPIPQDRLTSRLGQNLGHSRRIAEKAKASAALPVPEPTPAK